MNRPLWARMAWIASVLVLAGCGAAEHKSLDKTAELPGTKSNDSPFKLFNDGMKFYRVDKFDDAGRLLVQAAKLKPDYLEAHYYAAKSLLKARQTDLIGTEYHFLEVLKRKPDHIDAHIALSQAYYVWGRYDDARIHLDQVLDLSPDHRGALHYSGVIASRTGDLPRAEKLFRKVLLGDPKYGKSRVELASTLSHLDREDEALDQYLYVLQESPNQMRAILGAGTSLKRLGRDEEAEGFLVRFKRGQVAMEKAESRLKRIVVRVAVARRAYQEGRLDDARREAELFAQEFSDDADGLSSLGFMQAAESQDEAAAATLSYVLALDPSLARANETLIEVYTRLGDREKAASARAAYEIIRPQRGTNRRR
jgi:tetratricopeptide (TPR) repeat protein